PPAHLRPSPGHTRPPRHPFLQLAQSVVRFVSLTSYFPPPTTSAVTAPISAGESTIVAPAALSASFFAAAVPAAPTMIAPAWPILRPGGAVAPAMNATTGFFISLAMYSADCCPATPPIS